MRASYLRSLVALARLRRDPLLPARLAARVLAVHAAHATGRALAGPLHGIVAVTRACPFRCEFCDVAASVGDEASADALFRAVDDLADLGTLAVTFSGGEPMLEPALPDLVARARARGMLPHVSTTGWGLDRPGAARHLVRAGLAGVTVSVTHFDDDAPRPFRGALAALAELRDAAREAGRTLSRATTTVLRPGRESHDLETVRRLVSLGLAPAGVLPEHGGAGFAGRQDVLAAVAGSLLDLRRRTGRVDNSRPYLAALARCDRPDPLPVPCLAPGASWIVDREGRSYPCVPEWLEGRSVDAPGGPAAAWRSPAALDRRRSLRDCRRCLWNCHAETSCALSVEVGGVRV